MTSTWQTRSPADPQAQAPYRQGYVRGREGLPLDLRRVPTPDLRAYTRGHLDGRMDWFIHSLRS